ncbi:MAG: class I SAM-dependent methyltransferase, partial [Acidimicrobiales bacterium]
MKYEAKVDLRNANTSHALLIELVGRDKRVLDVGCASGYLGETLRQQGCTVAGVEYDAEAAEAAKAVLDEVVVGDVGELDLVGHFGAGSFDAVVFGDVLEHVVDPAGVLRRLRPLLAPGGAAVVSIPNVAHGAVRLSLMSGRFDYRPLGLLDDTHLRFFTRDSLHDLLAEAGFVAVDVRRTVAGVFDTEVAVRREDFDDHVVEAVEDDPDATTYQFVVKAVPRDEAEPPGAPPPAPPPPRAARCRVGIWADCPPDDATGALALRVTRREVAARLPDAAIRLFTARGYLDQSPHTGGQPVEPMGELSPERLAELADQLDCLVVTGDVGGAARSLGRALDQGPEERCPVLWSAVRPPAGGAPAAGSDLVYAAVLAEPGAAASASDRGLAGVPDPLVLADRALRPEALSRRLGFLRMMGWFPGDGDAVVVEVGGGLRRHAAELAPALQAVARPGRSVVLVQLHPADADATRLGEELAAAVPAYRVPPGAVVDDAVAALAA